MKRIKYLLKCITESLTKSPSNLGCALIAVTLASDGSSLSYLLPVMLFFACIKTGVFLLQSLFIINNPYRVLKYSIITALIGSFFLLSRDYSDPVYIAGAVITGLALAPFTSLYKIVSENDGSKDNKIITNFISLFIFLIFGLSCLKSKASGFSPVYYIFCAYLAIITIYIFIMPGKKKYSSGKVLTLREHAITNSIPSIFLFLMMASVSGYKSSGNGFVYAVMFLSFVLFEICEFTIDKRHVYKYTAVTIWLGAIRGFEMLYSLIYLTDSGNTQYIMALYFIILGSTLISPAVGRLFDKYDNYKKIKLGMIVSMIAMVLLISQKLILMLIAVIVCVCFTEICKSANLTYYREDTSVSPDEYYLRQDRMFSMGNGISQSFTMMVLFATGKLLYGSGGIVMKAYVLSDGMGQNGFVLLVGGIISIAVLFLGFLQIKNSKKILK